MDRDSERQRHEEQRRKWWNYIEGYFRNLEKKGSPWFIPFTPLREFFWAREGWYVLIRGVLLFLMLAAVNATMGETGWTLTALRWVFVGISALLLLEILIYHFVVAFVTKWPHSSLRSALLTIFSYGQITIAFATFNLAFASSLYFGETTSLPSWHTAWYFAVVTATTLGYGDVHARLGCRTGEFLVMAESFIGVMFVGVLVARLIGLLPANGQRTGDVKMDDPARK